MSIVEFLAVLVTLAALMLAVAAAVRATQARRVAEADLTRLAGRLLKMLEAERTRIGRELHDDISQQLAVLALELDALASLPSSEPQQVRRVVASLAQRVRSIAADVQRVTRELHPARLEYLGLVSAVRALGHDMEHYGLRIEVSSSDWPDKLPAAVALALYRVIQEALHNAARHSGADLVGVTFQGTPTTLRLTVSDAGIGFEPHQMDTLSGIGMTSMRQRLRSIGGSLSVHSAPGQGTRIQAVLPRIPSASEAKRPSAGQPDDSAVACAR
jgi:signal transduction histidine kinase